MHMTACKLTLQKYSISFFGPNYFDKPPISGITSTMELELFASKNKFPDYSFI